MKRIDASRRQFLRTSALASLAGPAAAPFALNLATMSAAHAQTANDYKALICLFMYGGNDHGNMVLATDDSSWDGYTRARNVPPVPITLDRTAVSTTTAIVPQTVQTSPAGQPGPRTFGLHPSMTGMKGLFDAGQVAVIANVGPMIEPVTRATWNARSVRLPPQLFSHNDQTSIWQAYRPEGAKVGWGGRLGDLFAAQNQFQNFTAISASGSPVFLSGDTVIQYQAGSNGGVQIGNLTGALFGSTSGANPLRAIASDDRENLFEKDYARIVRRSIDAQQQLQTALNATTGVPNPPMNTGLLNQLRMVARIIATRQALGMRRQVFLIGFGGFDTHDNQGPNHANLMATLSSAFTYFHTLMASPTMGTSPGQVAMFTASEFGRTLTSNGDGSDHGWGAHHFVTGASIGPYNGTNVVRGRDMYGRFPLTGANNDDTVGAGRLIPTVSVDEYAGELARWFGLSNAQVAEVFPNIVNFGNPTNRLLANGIDFMI